MLLILGGSNESTSRVEHFIQRYNEKTPPVDVMKWMVSSNLNTSSQDQEIDVVGVEPNSKLCAIKLKSSRPSSNISEAFNGEISCLLEGYLSMSSTFHVGHILLQEQYINL